MNAVDGALLHAKRFKDKLPHRAVVGIAQVQVRSITVRRCVPASGYKVIGVLECLAEAGGGTHLLHFGDAVLRANVAKSKDQIKIPPGHARARAHRMPHFQTLRHVGVGQSEAG
jgi:hypothetical protein